jgi:hypothetical protein
MSLSETVHRLDRPRSSNRSTDSGSISLPLPAIGPKLILAAIASLVLDTFRQAAASRMMLLALCLAGLGVLTCLSVRVEGPRTLHLKGEIELMDARKQPLTGPSPSLGRMTIGFGLATVGNFRDVESQVRFLQALLARWAAGVAGTLLLLASTAGFLPEFLRPGAASILLAKPVPRWTILAGKVLGVVAFVAVLAGGFIVGTWLALGARTGIWSTGYLLAWPLVVVQFAGLYAASVVAAVCTRNAAASLFSALACWLVCLAVNGARDSIQVPSGAPAGPPITRIAVEAAYWAMPKPIDLSRMLDRAISASDHFASPAAPDADASRGAIAASIGSSLAFAAAMLLIAARQLSTTDY